MKEMIEKHRGILVHLVNRYVAAMKGVMSFDELFQEATVSMWKAWERYEATEEHTAKFTTCLYHSVRNDLVRYVCEMGATIRVPRQGTAADRSALLIPTVSMDAPIEDGTELHNLVAPEPEAECCYEPEEIARVLRAVDALPPVDAFLVRERQIKGRTLADVAVDLGLTREGVRQREIKILKRLRKQLGGSEWREAGEALAA